jgi:hypothetical protein
MGLMSWRLTERGSGPTTSETASKPGDRMFVLIARYTKPAEEVDRLLDGHRAWITRNMTAGTILLTARQVPLTGGLILARGESPEQILGNGPRGPLPLLRLRPVRGPAVPARSGRARPRGAAGAVTPVLDLRTSLCATAFLRTAETTSGSPGTTTTTPRRHAHRLLAGSSRLSSVAVASFGRRLTTAWSGASSTEITAFRRSPGCWTSI